MPGVPATPTFSTDTAAVLRAAEIQADMILLAKNIDGVYSADPKKDPGAVKYDAISYDQVLADHLQVMDSDRHVPGYGEPHSRDDLRPGGSSEHPPGR